MKGYTSTQGFDKENGSKQTSRHSRMPLADITNEVDWLRHSLEGELVTPTVTGNSQETRRYRTSTTGRRTKGSSGRASGTSNETVRRRSDNPHSSDESSLGDEPLLSSPIQRPSAFYHLAPSQPTITSASNSLPSTADLAAQLSKLCNSEPGASSFGNREPWTTEQVPPKTHKTTSGQIVILPSHATLVDFREGERRKGKKGDEVIVVSPDGVNIKIFSAPHLSTPTCLAEPSASYALNALPVPYYKLYDQARKVIERIRKRIPKLVMYESDSTCTLMINEPLADIQVSMDTSTDASGTQLPAIRVRLSRKLLNVEISTSAGSRMSGGEWNHKVLFWQGRDTGIGYKELRRLSARERRAIQVLADFLPVAEGVEALRNPGLACDKPIVMDKREATEKMFPGKAAAGLPVPRKRSAVAFSPDMEPRPTADASASSSLASMNISPRPRLGLGPSPAKMATARKASSTVVNSRPQSVATNDRIASKEVSPLVPDTTLGVDMRFLPSTGWCIRFGEGAGTYRIMFFDGAVLEISIEDECVDFMPRDGVIERFTIRDCHIQRDVGNRMKAFEEFVSLFEDHSNR